MIKTVLILWLFISSFKSPAQIDYDCIPACEYFILKLSTDSNNLSKINPCNIKSTSIAEQYFGSNHMTSKSFSELFGVNFTKIEYLNGLTLELDDDHKTFFTFKITSKDYYMTLLNGKAVKTGMSLWELIKIFPKSFSKQNTTYLSGSEQGKTLYRVNFTIKQDNKTVNLGSGIIFIINKEGKLEKFYSYEPG